MAKKPKPDIFRRTDAERRIRQGERLSRLLRALRCIMGPGRWDADALARELEVSPRTIHRIMQSLSMANVPWFYCKKDGCYRVRSGFRFPGVEGKPARNSALTAAALRCVIDDLRKDLTRTVETLTRYSDQLAEDCDTT